jgi:uncharacterized membrane protein YqiK
MAPLALAHWPHTDARIDRAMQRGPATEVGPPQTKEINMKIRHAAILTSMMLALPMAASADLDKAVEKRAEAQYDAAKKRAELEYDSSKERCRALDGNARDVCVKEAEAAHTHAMADAEVKRKAAEAQADTLEDRAEANYKAAKERCDSLSGSAKDSCLADAKVLYRQ